MSGAWITVLSDGPGLRVAPDPLRDAYQNRPTAPSEGRASQGSTAMLGLLHQELARQKHREDHLQARRIRLLRAVRAERRAQRAVEVAVRASERLAATGAVGRAWSDRAW